MYANETRTFDRQMLAAWHKHLDVRLLFVSILSSSLEVIPDINRLGCSPLL